MNTLWLHVGTSKTGSTSIQYYLKTYREDIKQLGVSYPLLEKLDNKYLGCDNGIGLVNDILLDDASKIERWERNIDTIRKELEKRDVIISGESIWHLGAEFVKKLRETFDKIKVIVYLRRQDLWLESLYTQKIKRVGVKTSVDKMISDAIKNPEKEGYNYLQRLESYADIIGIDNIIVRPFERKQLINNNVVSDFLSLLRIDSLKNVNLSINERRSMICTEINEIFNSVYDDIKFSMDVVDFQALFMNFSKATIKDENTKYGYFGYDERLSFMKLFEKDNAEIARKYLGRTDGKLFLDDNYDIPKYEALSEKEKDIIKYISIIYMDLNRKYNEILGRRPAEIEALQKIIEYKSNGRKVYLFGAGKIGRKFLNYGLPIEGIVDNSQDLGGEEINEIKIIGLSDIKDYSDCFFVLTMNDLNSKVVSSQLDGLGLIFDKDYISGTEYLPRKF